MKWLLAAIYLILLIACSSSSDNVGTPEPDSSLGTPPALKQATSWKKTIYGSTNTDQFEIGDEIRFWLTIVDPDLDIYAIEMTRYYLNQSNSVPYSGPDQWKVEQPDVESIVSNPDWLPVTGPEGQWRFDFKVYDIPGNASSVVSVNISISQSEDI